MQHLMELFVLQQDVNHTMNTKYTECLHLDVLRRFGKEQLLLVTHQLYKQ